MNTGGQLRCTEIGPPGYAVGKLRFAAGTGIHPYSPDS